MNEIFIRDALEQGAGMRTDVLRLREKARMPNAVHGDNWPICGMGACAPKTMRLFH